MITISLDEFGDFEQIKNNNDQAYIGGVLFDDGGDRANMRRRRAESTIYLKQVCRLAGRDCRYPRDFHVCKSKSNAESA